MAVTEAPVLRSNLREQIKDVMLQRIVSGAYPPGARLVETRIAQELGVSQAPVREALRDLEQLGCIVHEPFRGCSVRAFSANELLEAFPVRAALGPSPPASRPSGSRSQSSCAWESCWRPCAMQPAARTRTTNPRPTLPSTR